MATIDDGGRRPDPFGLGGRVALVTGGGDGIGAFIATALAARGAAVAVVGRRQAPLDAKVAEIVAAGGRAVAITADVTDPDAAARAVDGAVAALGRIDVLVNNVGGARQAPLRKLTPERWRAEFALNLDSAFYCMHAAYPHMAAAGGGAIVNVSSLAGVHGTVGAGAYSAAKAGLQMLSVVAAAEWGPKRIRVNCVAAGMTATPRVEAGWAKAGMDLMAAAQTFALRRPGRPEEVADAVVFLASDAAGYVSGETLAVGGGPTIKGMIDED